MPQTPSSSSKASFALPAGITQEMYEQTRERLRRYLAGEQETFSVKASGGSSRPRASSSSSRNSLSRFPTCPTPESLYHGASMLASAAAAEAVAASAPFAPFSVLPASKSQPFPHHFTLEDVASRRPLARSHSVSTSSFQPSQQVKQDRAEHAPMSDDVFTSKASPVKEGRMSFQMVPSTPAQCAPSPTPGRGAKGMMERILTGARPVSTPTRRSSMSQLDSSTIVDVDDEEEPSPPAVVHSQVSDQVLLLCAFS
jgi:hypothetical protein